ncbi:MAG: hypothetical protein OXC40_04180, partial [Proteobacteria bacterium]|nr:hypothetical protein [Pseudomonadota bacterium]
MKKPISSSYLCLFLLFLSVLLFWHGCSSASNIDYRKKLPPLIPDPNADPPEVLPEISKIPTTPRTDLPDKLREKRDEIARNYCSSQGVTDHRTMLNLLSCRVNEQNEWLDHSNLYRTKETSCTTQTGYLRDQIFNLNGDKGTGTNWLTNACQAIADQLFTGKVIEQFNKDGLEPDSAALVKKFKELLRTSSDFKLSGDDKGTSTNIKLMLAYSIFRLNHNCAAAMTTGDFSPKRIAAPTTINNLTRHYIFTRHNQGTYNRSTNNPFSRPLAGVWPLIARNIQVGAYTNTKKEKYTGADASQTDGATLTMLEGKQKSLTTLWNHWFKYG